MTYTKIQLEDLALEIHRSNTGRIIVNCPGYNGTINGWENKYIKLGNHIQEKNLGSMVRIDNLDPFNGWDLMKFGDYMVKKLRKTIDYSIANSQEICASSNPLVFLMGTSAGGAGISIVAHKYKEVDKILLIAPAGLRGRNKLKNSLKKFTGQIYILIGKNDEVVGPEAGQLYYDMAINASNKELVELPNCNHNFAGEVNGRIMSRAPFWAFSMDDDFPNPEGGIKLYD